MRRGQKTSAEQVVLKLRQIEVQTEQVKSTSVAYKEADVSEWICEPVFATHLRSVIGIQIGPTCFVLDQTLSAPIGV
jgi:hypothetical protein